MVKFKKLSLSLSCSYLFIFAMRMLWPPVIEVVYVSFSINIGLYCNKIIKLVSFVGYSNKQMFGFGRFRRICVFFFAYNMLAVFLRITQKLSKIKKSHKNIKQNRHNSASGRCNTTQWVFRRKSFIQMWLLF